MEWYSPKYDKWNLVTTMNCSHSIILGLFMSDYNDLLWSYNNFSAPKRTICLPGFYKNIRKNRNPSQTKTKIGERDRQKENLWSWIVINPKNEKEIITTHSISILLEFINAYMKFFCVCGA